jgi:hypothetical protein
MSVADLFIRRFEYAVSTAVGTLRTASSYLTARDDWVEGLRRRLAVTLDPVLSPLGRPLIAEKGRADRVCVVDASPDAVERALLARYQRNLASTRKYRLRDGERDWAVGSFVYDPDDTDWQHHVYLFDNGDGTTDLYAHKEASAASDPYGHVTKPQIHGDPDGIARGTLEEAHFEYQSHP